MKPSQLTIARVVARTSYVALLASLAAPAFAQSGILEEVTVTAQKREESIQDVGIAVTAFSGEQLEAFGFSQSTEIAAFTPGIHISGNNGGSTQQFTIRGATQNDFADIAEGPNAVYVDEAYMATGQSQLFAAFDVERVEMLKGPQGTLFGRNATGGLVHYVTRKPTETLEGFVDVTYGDYDLVRTEAAISGPIAQNLLGRASVLYRRHDPLMDNVFTGAFPTNDPLGFRTLQGSPAGQDDIWKDDQIAARGQLLFNVSDDAEVLLKGQYGKQQLTSGQYQLEATTGVYNSADQQIESVFTNRQPAAEQSCKALVDTGGCRPGGIPVPFDLDFGFSDFRPEAGGDFFGYVEPDTRDLNVNTDHTTDDYDEVETWGVSGKADWDLGWANLVAVGAYHELDKRQSLDVDSGPAPQFIVMNESESQWWSAELRLEGEADRFRWIGGFYYLGIDMLYSQGLADSIGGLNVFSVLFGGALPDPRTPLDSLESTLDAALDTRSYSLFGQIDYDITDQWMLTFGLRAIQEEKDYTYRVDLYDNIDDRTTDSLQFRGQQPLVPNFFLFDLLPNQRFASSTSDTLWSGKIALNWTPTDDLLMYASISRGVKAGSFNAPLLTNLTPDQMEYDEEVLLSYEVGFKSTLFDGRARLNGAFYYYDYTDYQAFQFVGTSGAVFNADAVYYGMELELQANPIDNMDFVLGLGLIDATVEDLAVASPVPGVAPAVLRDVSPSFTPSVQVSGILRYTWPAAVLGGDVAFQADANYASSAFHNLNNFKTHKMPAYVVGNLRLDWFSQDEHWEVGAFVNNVADERYQTIGFELSTVTGSNEETIGAPRWWGISARYNWF